MNVMHGGWRQFISRCVCAVISSTAVLKVEQHHRDETLIGSYSSRAFQLIDRDASDSSSIHRPKFSERYTRSIKKVSFFITAITLFTAKQLSHFWYIYRPTCICTVGNYQLGHIIVRLTRFL